MARCCLMQACTATISRPPPGISNPFRARHTKHLVCKAGRGGGCAPFKPTPPLILAVQATATELRSFKTHMSSSQPAIVSTNSANGGPFKAHHTKHRVRLCAGGPICRVRAFNDRFIWVLKPLSSLHDMFLHASLKIAGGCGGGGGCGGSATPFETLCLHDWF